MNIIDINKNLCPYQLDMQLSNVTYTFRIRYNSEFDYFTTDLLIGETEILNGEKILYGRELFLSHNHLNIPRGIIPLDVADEQIRAGYNELGDTVFLYLVGDSDAL